MPKRWYVRETQASAPIGPVTLEELGARARAGHWQDALVCVEDGAEWRPLHRDLAAIEASAVSSAGWGGSPSTRPSGAPQTYASLPPRAGLSLGAAGLIVAT